MPNYSGFEPQRPFGSFIAGMGAADTMRHTALKNEAMQASLEQQKRQRETAEQFKATGDPRELRGYDPALAVTIENSLATMDTHKQEAAIKRLTAGIDITDKALPYIVAASKSNPAAAANMWPQYIADLTKAGIQPPPFMQQFSPETLEAVQKQKEDLKTAIARINAASRDRVAAGNQAVQIYGADRRYEGAVDAANIRARAPKGGASSDRFPKYDKYEADVRAGKIPGISPDADQDTIIRGFNAANSGGKAAGQAEHPKPLKPVEQMMEDTLYPKGRPGATGKQPGAAPKAVRSHIIRDKQGRDVTSTFSDADYDALLKAKGLR